MESLWQKPESLYFADSDPLTPLLWIQLELAFAWGFVVVLVLRQGLTE